MSRIFNVVAVQKKVYGTPEQNMSAVRQMLDTNDGNSCTGPLMTFLCFRRSSLVLMTINAFRSLRRAMADLRTDFSQSWRVTGGCM